MPRLRIEDVLADADEFGLLAVETRATTAVGGEVGQVLGELERFITTNGRPPSSYAGTPIAERILATKAKRLSGDPAIGALLLPVEPIPPNSVDDILGDDLLDVTAGGRGGLLVAGHGVCGCAARHHSAFWSKIRPRANHDSAFARLEVVVTPISLDSSA